eukprot:Clim_evm3s172 gene=Clim_evmTU3s172
MSPPSKVLTEPSIDSSEVEEIKVVTLDAKLYEGDKDSKSSQSVDAEYDPEVKDMDTVVVTPRVVVVATVFTFAWSYINQIGNYRTVAFSLDNSVAFLVSYLVLALMARSIPSYKFRIGPYTLDTNPGPFNVREHVMVGLVTSDSVNGAYVANTLFFMEEKLGQNIGWFGDFMLILCTNMVGYGLAILFYRFLIMARGMPWPTAIFQAEVFKMLHEDSNSRLRVFFLIGALSLIYQWIPGFFWPGLVSVSALCWIAAGQGTSPNGPLQVLGRGLSQGFGVGTLMFDLSIFTAYFGFLMYVPAWLGFNAVAGGIIFAWFAGPWVYFTNFANSQNIDPKGLDLYLANGTDYPIELLFNDELEWQQEVYDTYGFAYLSGFNSVTYFISFVALTAAVSHTLVWHWDDIVGALGKSNSTKSKHAIAMEELEKEAGKSINVPYWFGMLFIAIFAGAFIATNYAYNISMPWWAVIVSIILAAFFMVPIGAVLSVTGNMLGLNILCEMIGGLMLHHNPNGAILVKVTGYIGMYHGLILVQNMKMCQFYKINYRTVLAMQAWGTFVAALADTTAYRNVMDNNLLDGSNPDWNSTNLEIYTTASYLWGGIGPYEAWMSPDSPYRALFFGGLAAGLVLPVVFWGLSRYWSIFKWIHIPMMTLMPAFANINSWFITTGFMVLLFQVLMPKFWPKFYKDNLYISAAGLTAGLGIGSFVIAMLTGFGHVNMDNLPAWTDPDAGCSPMFLPADVCTITSFGVCEAPQ